MSRDYAEKEREFIESLKADTGRDLDGWMTAIGERNFVHRNDTIDWLRQQGFLFAWASWLERIHNNGGQPIYYDETAPARSPAQPPRRPPAPPATTPPPPHRENLSISPPPPIRIEGASVIRFPGARPASPAPPPRTGPQPASPPRAIPSEVMAVVAGAKAYAPLAGFLIRRISETLPATQLRAGRQYIEMRAGPLPYALLAIGGKDLKLAFAGPPGRFDPPAEKARLPNLGAPLSPLLTHMLSLSDAREIDEAFLETLHAACARVQK
ncbi:MAG: hypothetical protein KJ587_14365 [Alphaproteobacteria bacterium]|nr:hypothetical protein [Alphaproteobacteria bacterium]